MDREARIKEQLAALAAHLHDTRDAILRAWREAADRDCDLHSGASLSLAQFNDHIPEVLDAFEHKLSSRDRKARRQARAEEGEGAAGHGLHRWQQGYDQREVMQEWGHLQLVLLDALEEYAEMPLNFEKEVMPTARRYLAQMCSEGVSQSAAQYARLKQAEAAGRVHDLEHAISQLRELERARAEMLREATHDLRNNLGLVRNAAVLLKIETMPEAQRPHFVSLLEKGVTSLHGLLNDLSCLARLEAGHEKRRVSAFDLAATIKDMCSNMQPFARERGLFLRSEGPAHFMVEGDAIKIQRIVQNLLLNALKYTKQGGVRVTWSGTDGLDRWMLSVQDTGPGLKNGNVTPLATALKLATEGAQDVEQTAEEAGTSTDHAEPALTLHSLSPQSAAFLLPGEGVGLSIVKRLCELLDASLELETSAGEGTTFRVTFPCAYTVAGECVQG